MNKLALTWTDKDGKDHRKEYTDVREANKARKWLVDNGADNVDLAVVLINKKGDSHESQMFPVR